MLWRTCHKFIVLSAHVCLLLSAASVIQWQDQCAFGTFVNADSQILHKHRQSLCAWGGLTGYGVTKPLQAHPSVKFASCEYRSMLKE